MLRHKSAPFGRTYRDVRTTERRFKLARDLVETSAFDATGFGIADGVVDPSGRKALGGHHAELRQPAVVDGLRGFDEPAVDNTPHEGHAAAVGSAVTACTTRVPSARRSTCSTRHAWQPEKQCRTFGHDPLVPVFRLKFRKLQTSEGQGPAHAATRPMRAKPQLPV